MLPVKSGLTDLDARGRRRLMPLGWLAVGVVVFAVLAGGLYAAVASRRARLREVAGPPAPSPAAPLPPTTNPSPAPTPSPTDNPLPHPITWTVREYQTVDGRRAYMVEQPEVLDVAKRSYMEFWAFFAFLDGLPDDHTLGERLDFYTVEGPSRQGILSLVEEYRTQWHGYWRKQFPTDLMWGDDGAEFSADGSRLAITLVFPAGAISGEWVDFSTGRVTDRAVNSEIVLRVKMQYDPIAGRWKTVSDERINP